jgi:peptidoglycan/LPS O-acetylase OafA/YrhL
MTKYRPEIDGLRAIAVLPVIFFHAGFETWQGGFVGVDVFFVISGYLITSLILSEKQNGTFSIVRFYERRARRILPALFLVMIACLPFAWFWMLPYELKDFSRSILAVCTFVSNIFFWKQIGYFASDAALQPLLHTWSLSVEEQYYVFFPIVLLVFWRLGRRPLIGLFSLATLASFLVAHWGSTNHPDAAFYLLPTRSWELLVGALAAFHHVEKNDVFGVPSPRNWPHQLLSLIGVGLIAYAVFQFDSNVPFPGLYALVPTIGAVLIILTAGPQVIVGQVLAHPWIVKIGLISYSAYLWHQPIFTFVRLRMPTEPSSWLLMLLAILSLVLAYLSWKYVETPFRDKSKLGRKGVFIFATLASALMIGIGLVGVYANGFSGRLSKRALELAVSPSDRGKYVTGRHTELRINDGFSTSGQRKLAVIGDSYSEDFVNMIDEAAAFREYEIRTHYIPTRCQIYVGNEDTTQFVAKTDQRFCKADYHTRLRSLVRDADVIIFTASWKEWAARRLPLTLQGLNIAPNKEVIIVGAKNFGVVKIRNYLDMDIDSRLKQKNPVLPQFLETNKLLSSLIPQEKFVDIHEIMCGKDSPTCPVFTREGKLISHDGGHLTKDGAIFIGKKVFAQSLLNKFR